MGYIQNQNQTRKKQKNVIAELWPRTKLNYRMMVNYILAAEGRGGGRWDAGGDLVELMILLIVTRRLAGGGIIAGMQFGGGGGVMCWCWVYSGVTPVVLLYLGSCWAKQKHRKTRSCDIHLCTRTRPTRVLGSYRP